MILSKTRTPAGEAEYQTIEPFLLLLLVSGLMACKEDTRTTEENQESMEHREATYS